MAAIRTILHPTDFSEDSHCAFQLACSLAKTYRARLVVVHVAEPPRAELYSGIPVVQQLEAHEAKERKKLHELKPHHSTLVIQHRMVKGVPAEEILRVAQEIEADLVVMGTHGRSGIRRFLVGSVAETVLRKAKCPVLTVKAAMGPANTNARSWQEVTTYEVI